MPLSDLGEGRGEAVEHADDEGRHGCEEGPIFAAGDHGDARREAVDAPEVEEVGDECCGEGDARGGEQVEQDREV